VIFLGCLGKNDTKSNQTKHYVIKIWIEQLPTKHTKTYGTLCNQTYNFTIKNSNMIDKIIPIVNDVKIAKEIVIALLPPNQKVIIDYLTDKHEFIDCKTIATQLNMVSKNVSSQIKQINTKAELISICKINNKNFSYKICR
jgi:hypothetical protein